MLIGIFDAGTMPICCEVPVHGSKIERPSFRNQCGISSVFWECMAVPENCVVLFVGVYLERERKTEKEVKGVVICS